MHVALPEVDGRILTRAISFKGEAQLRSGDAMPHRHLPAGAGPHRLRRRRSPPPGRVCARRRPAERRVALILANYPNRDGRIANGVGLDTPAGTAGSADGHGGGRLSAGGAAAGRRRADRRGCWPARPMRAPSASGGPRNSALAAYRALSCRACRRRCPRASRGALGAAGERSLLRAGGFRPAAPSLRQRRRRRSSRRAATTSIPTSTYHDPTSSRRTAISPSTPGCAQDFGAHAIIHLGKHGNLEWLPGKATGAVGRLLSGGRAGAAAAALSLHRQRSRRGHPGQAPHRGGHHRSSDAAADPRRDLWPARAISKRWSTNITRRPASIRRALRPRCASRSSSSRAAAGSTRDCGIAAADDASAALRQARRPSLRAEGSCRSATACMSSAPRRRAQQLTDLLVALTRVPRGVGEGARCLADPRPGARSRLGDGFDPLDCDLAASLDRPAARASCRTSAPTPGAPPATRSSGSKLLARQLVGRRGHRPMPAWQRDASPCSISSPTDLRPRVAACGTAEIAGLLRGLDGRFVAPGPSGAPTRGRLEVLPTGPQFLFGRHPRRADAGRLAARLEIGRRCCSSAISRTTAPGREPWRSRAWGTSNMRTGGDDIAQALALIGVKPGLGRRRVRPRHRLRDPAAGRCSAGRAST